MIEDNESQLDQKKVPPAAQLPDYDRQSQHHVSPA